MKLVDKKFFVLTPEKGTVFLASPVEGEGCFKITFLWFCFLKKRRGLKKRLSLPEKGKSFEKRLHPGTFFSFTPKKLFKCCFSATVL